MGTLLAAFKGIEIPELIASQTPASNAAKASKRAPEVNFILLILISNDIFVEVDWFPTNVVEGRIYSSGMKTIVVSPQIIIM